MSLWKCVFLITIFYSQCSGRKKNNPLEQLEGSWTVNNASKNALPLMEDCPSVEIQPPPKNSSDQKGMIFYKSLEKTYTLIVEAVDQTEYRIYYPYSNGSQLGSLTILKVEKSTFIVTKFKMKDDIYYAVLTNGNKTSSDVDKKVRKYWNSSQPAENVDLFPIERNNCSSSLKRDNSSEVNIAVAVVSSVSITTASLEQTRITSDVLHNVSLANNQSMQFLEDTASDSNRTDAMVNDSSITPTENVTSEVEKNLFNQSLEIPYIEITSSELNQSTNASDVVYTTISSNPNRSIINTVDLWLIISSFLLFVAF